MNEQRPPIVGQVKPLALDLCCGEGGWTEGLQAAGFHVTGLDVQRSRDYAGDEFILQDIREYRPRAGSFDVVVASPPCNKFSLFRAYDTNHYPDAMDFELVLHCIRVIREIGPKFWAIENVRGAYRPFQPILGEPDFIRGPWYIWGRLPPFLTETSGPMRKLNHQRYGGSGLLSKRRRAAISAKIPLELARPFAVAAREAL